MTDDLQTFFEDLLLLTPPFEIMEVDKPEGKQTNARVNITIQVDATYCPSNFYTIHSYKTKSWRHLDLFQFPCYIHCRVPMYLDKRDGSTILLEVPWARKNSGFTLLFEMKSLELLRLTGCKSAVARHFDIYPQRVETIYNSYTRHAFEQREPQVAQRVALDETSTRKGHDYISVFWDMEQDRLLDLRPGKSGAVVEAYVRECELLGQHPRQVIDEIVCDMSPAFGKGIREQLPTTRVTFDRFHVVQLIHRYLEPLKRSKTTDHTRLYAYIDELDQLWQQPDESSAAAFLTYWMDRGEELFGLRRLRKSINRHFTGIIAYCRTRLTNGKLEGINNKIQWIKRAARGYRTKDNFMRMVWFMFTPQTLTHQPIP